VAEDLTFSLRHLASARAASDQATASITEGVLSMLKLLNYRLIREIM
jgi:hypothetical protein